MDTNISTFSTSAEQILFRAFLQSTGPEQVELDAIDIGYTQSTATTNSETVYYMVVEEGAWTLEDGTAIEAGVEASVGQVNCRTGCGGWNQGTDLTYTNSYTTPVVFHSIMSENDSDWITSFVSDDTSNANPPGTDGFQVALHGAEVTTSHAAEDIGWVVIEGEVTGTMDSVDYETDRTTDSVTGHGTDHIESFDQTYGSAPWALVTKLEEDGGDGGFPMIDSISATQIDMYVDEDQTGGSERDHTTETFGYMAMASAGSFDLYEETANTDPITVSLQESYTNPVVITQPFMSGEASPFSTRVYDVTADEFTVRFDFPDDNAAPTDTDYRNDVYYLVMDEGQYQIGSTLVEAKRESISTVGTNSSWVAETKSYDHTYPSGPIVLHQVMSDTDTDWITTWVSNDGDRTQAPDTSDFQIALNSAEVTPSDGHGPEEVGWIVFQDLGTTDTTDGGTSFYTDIYTVNGGHDNGCYTNTHGTGYSDPIIFGSMMTVNGGNGGWGGLCSESSTSVGFHVEEDQYVDSERAHIAETFGYVVFDGAFDEGGQAHSSGAGTYESVIFGDGTTERNWNSITWTEDTTCSGCNVQLQVRTATNATDILTETYVGPDGTSGTYFEDARGDLLHTDHIGDTFIQYYATLTGGSGSSPLLEDVSLNYYEN